MTQSMQAKVLQFDSTTVAGMEPARRMRRGGARAPTLASAIAVTVVLMLTLATAAVPRWARAETATSTLSTPPAPAKPAKRPVVRHWHGYGFLPGYRPPEVAEHEDAWLYWRRHPTYYWYGGPGFYRGRWNGGGFGPCWTQTPIGNVWNCGR
jgi:hypothetical protein